VFRKKYTGSGPSQFTEDFSLQKHPESQMLSLRSGATVLIFVFLGTEKIYIHGLQNKHQCLHGNKVAAETSRRDVLGGLAWACGAGVLAVGGAPKAAWSAAAVQDSLDVDEFLRRGVDMGGTMGVSSQAGKSRPETGVFLRDGSEVSRNRKTGDVNAEIVVKGTDGEQMAVFVGYSSPWPLGKKFFPLYRPYIPPYP
jgi:hypothetical protein